MGNRNSTSTSVLYRPSLSLLELSRSPEEDEANYVREREVDKYMTKKLGKLLLTCDICCNLFDFAEHAPKSLSCQHTICLYCLKNIHERDGRNRELPCPKCRRVFRWEGSLKDVPNDHKIVKLIDFLAENAKGNVNVCLSHGLKRLKLFCTTCEAPLCKECSTTNHTAGHRFVAIEEGMAPKLETATEILTEARLVLSKLQQRQSSLLDMMGNINIMKDISEVEIDEIFEGLRLDLDIRKNQLKDILHEKCASSKAKITERRKQLSHIEGVYKKQAMNLATAVEKKDFVRLCTLMMTSQQVHESVWPMADYDDEDLEPHIAFNIPQNMHLVTQLKNIGEIEEKPLSEDDIETSVLEGSKLDHAFGVCFPFITPE
ncbi:tripartite motif containing 13 [Biomphalaria glabrata]|uniref:Tripartite motif containing 13-like n=1 Tax=Biomphalaria glabrata TaxID=6526 RepID=A0A9U8ED52_BIOGL|nr:tripartite motif containing 13-like [Biomphalaria glabrata]XP_013083184.2 tripartite motif containing 13-like [Biomphalaria glabrata]XP_013083193.2 tripartite motif containing 13-like [Biomphalaria glabrata]XP_055862194.1 tripartite motif containing 13-like [Biomphalaria glabrata]KAI8738126.1 tripartite motif containing 13-like [Biomphalaria glabrata]